MHWFTFVWWRYLFTGISHRGEKKRYSWTAFWCRLRGHPDGPVWFNCGGLEPDMSCHNCGDEL
jgi:hypothetical protein